MSLFSSNWCTWLRTSVTLRSNLFVPISQSTLHQPLRFFSKREVKRFYKIVSISQTDGQFEINLDRKRLKTPLGRVLRIPNEGLALAVAAEWDKQKGLLEPSGMYLTNLCNTATDTPVPQSDAERARDILEYLETDTVRFRVEEPDHLVALQTAAWDPVINWLEKRHQVVIPFTKTIVAPPISLETMEVFTRFLTSYDAWSLIGMECLKSIRCKKRLMRSFFSCPFVTGYALCLAACTEYRNGLQHMVESLKSVVLALALLDRHISVETAVALSRLEEEYQIGHWGRVEYAHDVEVMHLQSSIAASLLFVFFNTELNSVNQKMVV